MKKKIGLISILIIVFIVAAYENRENKGTGIKRKMYPGIGKVKKRLGNVEEASLLFKDSIIDFSAKTISLLQSQTKEENVLYTPLNYYMTLSVLSQITEDETQDQLVKILDVKEVDLEKLQVIKDYVEIHGAKVVPGEVSIQNSIWMNQCVNCNNDVVNNAKKIFQSDIFRVDFSKKKTKESMKRWICSHCHKLSKEYLAEEKMDQRIGYNHSKRSLMLLHSFNFSNEWLVPFDREQVKKGEFTKGDGKKVICDFMEGRMDATVYEGGNFKVVGIPFKNGAKLLTILPNQCNVGVNEVLEDKDEVAKMIRECGKTDKRIDDVTLQIPRFSLEKKFSFYHMTKELGIEDWMNADQTSNIRQLSEFSIDENGCMTSESTDMDVIQGQSGPKEKEEMVLNRSFGIILIKNEVPLLYGIVNSPIK